MLCLRPVISYVSNEQKMKRAKTLELSAVLKLCAVLKLSAVLKLITGGQRFGP